jgi:hypothetical protein
MVKCAAAADRGARTGTGGRPRAYLAASGTDGSRGRGVRPGRAIPRANRDRRQATASPSEPCWATPSDTRRVTGGQGITGSNPAVPTGKEVFSNVVMPHASQEKSQFPREMVSQGRAAIFCHDVSSGHLSIRQRRRRQLVKGSKIADPVLAQPRSGATRRGGPVSAGAPEGHGNRHAGWSRGRAPPLSKRLQLPIPGGCPGCHHVPVRARR